MTPDEFEKWQEYQRDDIEAKRREAWVAYQGCTHAQIEAERKAARHRLEDAVRRMNQEIKAIPLPPIKDFREMPNLADIIMEQAERRLTKRVLVTALQTLLRYDPTVDTYADPDPDLDNWFLKSCGIAPL